MRNLAFRILQKQMTLEVAKTWLKKLFSEFTQNFQNGFH